MANLYAILGVPRTASAAEIKSAYRRLARLYHPDVNASPAAAEQFALINQAYRTLANEERRREYDQIVTARTTRNLQAQAERIAHRVHFEESAERIVVDWLNKERQERDVRGKAIYTTVTLFLSTFMVAMTRPTLFEMGGSMTRVALLVLFATGVWHLFGSLALYFDFFTYQAGKRTRRRQSRSLKPFNRTVAWTFVVGGYLVSFMTGLLIGNLTDDFASTHTFEESLSSTFWKVVLYPPMAVLVVDTIYRINLRLEN
ncbi:MAG: J domain-containing protein [Blastocatellia bacterium]